MNNPAKMYDFIRLYPRLTADPVLGRAGEIYYNASTNRLRICVSASPVAWRDVSGGDVSANLYDPVATTLPTGPSATIDNISVTNGMKVLFSNLSMNNNRIYQVSGVGTSMVWTVQADWSSGLDATAGEKIVFTQGTSYAMQTALFNGTTFKINDVTRFFSGTDYWEMSSLKTFNFINNTTSNVFSMNVAGSENMILDYSIARGTAKETGTIHVTSDGTSVSFSSTGSYLSTVGILFNFYITSGTLYFDITANNSGSDGAVKYFIRRWSNSPGGPGGPPSYSTGAVSPTAAAGTSGEVQFNASNLLGADSNFKWDGSDASVDLNSFKISALSAPIALIDNTANALIATIPAAYRYIIVSFGITREGKYRVGRMLIVNDGSSVNFQDDSLMTDDPLVTLSATIVGSDINIRYTTNATGFDGQMRYSITKFTE